jgi:hypothetical protein
MVLVLIHFEVVDTTYMSTLVRLSGLLSIIRISLAWYKMHPNVNFKPFDCEGKVVLGVAQDEVDRILALSRANQKREDAEAAVTATMSSIDYLRHVMMRAVANTHFGHHVLFPKHGVGSLTSEEEEDKKLPAEKRQKTNNSK